MDKYNIIILPCLLLFDKNGKNLDNLNNDEIENITNEKIIGWKNTFNLIIGFKKVEKYYIGAEGAIFGHAHILFYSDYLSKNPKYGKGNWFCDLCGQSHPYSDNNFYCDPCGFDVCDKCFEKNKKY